MSDCIWMARACLLESAYAARPVKEYAALFDTVYISMYKYFNAASGAVLAGPKAQLAGLYHTRRMFGGGLHQVLALRRRRPALPQWVRGALPHRHGVGGTA